WSRWEAGDGHNQHVQSGPHFAPPESHETGGEKWSQTNSDDGSSHTATGFHRFASVPGEGQAPGGDQAKGVVIGGDGDNVVDAAGGHLLIGDHVVLPGDAVPAAGHDVIVGGDGGAYIFGDHLIYASGADPATPPADYVAKYLDPSSPDFDPNLAALQGTVGGDDDIQGGAGNDVIYAGAGTNHVDAGAGDDVVYGGVGNDTILGRAGDDTLIGGGGADVLRGGAGDDTIVAKAGFAEIAGGAGFDTFKFDDAGVLDLSVLNGKVTGIEKADITGTGNVEFKLTYQDLLTMTDSGHQLTIVGDNGDKVSADFSGHSVAMADMGSFTRYVIDGGAATLDIDNHVQANIVGI
ncbi:MAG: hypothetical protein KIT16_20185, partial [Rhodospirillaceae bacterium]|nr:hypothetical protein [Rhodospirillaceae bacterium]